jgi:hypothetical protein
VAKPVQGGLWYTFATAKLLGAVTADMDDLQEHSGSTSTLQLHRPHTTCVTHGNGFDLAAVVMDVLWWAVLLIPLLQQELRDWPYSKEVLNYSDSDDNDGDDGDEDNKKNNSYY